MNLIARIQRELANSPSRRKQLEWISLTIVLALAGAVFVFLHLEEVDRVNATERGRLNDLTRIVANDIQYDLAVANLTLLTLLTGWHSG
jgi:hypothetical protein